MNSPLACFVCLTLKVHVLKGVESHSTASGECVFVGGMCVHGYTHVQECIWGGGWGAAC